MGRSRTKYHLVLDIDTTIGYDFFETFGVLREFRTKTPKIEKEKVFEQRGTNYTPPKFDPPDQKISKCHISKIKKDRIIK